MPAIRRAVGEIALNALFNESFHLHPEDPVEGAREVRAKLQERYADHMRNVTPVSRKT